jgi:hypothetical protein
MLRRIAQAISLRGRLRKISLKVFYLLTNNTDSRNQISDEQVITSSLKDLIESQSRELGLNINIHKFTGGAAYLYMLAQTLNIIKTAKSKSESSVS